VAAFATTADVGMNKTEKSRRRKSALTGVNVTQAAIILCRDMILSFTDCDVSIMASGAVATIYAQMIEANPGKGIKEVGAVT